MIDISKFNEEQREVLSDAICHLSDSRVFAVMANPEYSPAQMKELLMCALNGSSIYLSEPWELPDGLLEREQEKDYQRVKKLAESFARSGDERASVAGKLYEFSLNADEPLPIVDDAMVK